MQTVVYGHKEPINRKKEIGLIGRAFDALIERKHILSTPIIDFFGIDGIGKSRILQYVYDVGTANNLLCIRLDGSQSTVQFSRTMLQQIRKYRKKQQDSTDLPKKGDSYTQAVEVIKRLLESNRPTVIVLDSIDTTNEELVNWIELTLRDLIKFNNLFVVLASKQKIVFENDWSMARKLTPCELKPLNQIDSKSYLTSIDTTITAEVREIVFQWTRGYPLAMDVMIKAIQKHSFDLENIEDQKRLMSILILQVIDKKVLALVEPSQLDWYKDYLRILSMPRRFNLVIMQALLEEFGSSLTGKPQNKLEYMGLPKQLNTKTYILHWDMQKAGFSIDESVRNIFFHLQRIENPSLFVDIHRFLALQNRKLATEVTGSDSVRYLREYLYHSAYSSDDQGFMAILIPTLEQISKLSQDDIVQFSEEFTQDGELQEVLRIHKEYVYSFIKEHTDQV